MSAAQIQPRTASIYSSSDDDRKSAHHLDSSDEKETQPTPGRALGEDGQYLREDDESIGAVGLPWSKKGPALAMILLFVCESGGRDLVLGGMVSSPLFGARLTLLGRVM